jgi:hypothetical protein
MKCNKLNTQLLDFDIKIGKLGLGAGIGGRGVIL